MRVPEKLLALINDENSFFISTHINPDGDALGSSLALSLALESLGKKTVLYDRDRVPEFYRFLPAHEKFSASLPSNGQPLILLDCNEPGRAGLDDVVLPYSAVIDHHETVRDFGDIRWVDPHAAATGIMVYYLIKELGLEITQNIATNLYTAIAVDTGTFRYSNTNSELLRVCAELIDSGADPASISLALYEAWSERRFRLLIEVLNTLEIVDHIAFTFVTKEMFIGTGTTAEDTEHFSNFPRMMEHVEVSAFFRETDGAWKVSLRSKGSVDVARIAERFNGGGHRNAAGYKITADIKTAKEELIKEIQDV
ncbi:MAG: bifunctional oligoribonuclease/PAP phosphatase NrnA [Thermodesulfovibrionales bacterium]